MLFISDDDTVMMIRMITVKTIKRMKMVTILLLLWIFFHAQILKANMVVGAIWCLLVCYRISHAEHKLSHDFLCHSDINTVPHHLPSAYISSSGTCFQFPFILMPDTWYISTFNEKSISLGDTDTAPSYVYRERESAQLNC